MLHAFVFLIIIIISTSIATTDDKNWDLSDVFPPTKCGDHWLEYKGSCYYRSDNHETFEAAYKDCDKMNSSLITVNSMDELTFVTTKKLNPHWNFATTLWLGLFKKDAKSDYIWQSSGGMKASKLPWKKGSIWTPQTRCVYYDLVEEQPTNEKFVYHTECSRYGDIRNYYICERTLL